MSQQVRTIQGGQEYTGPGVVGPEYDNTTVTEKISNLVLRKDTELSWFAGVAIGAFGGLILLVSVTYLVLIGTGIWGLNVPVGWGFAIINFVWWIGIGHAGTLISAILHLMQQSWRNSINRFAEAMTIFAVISAILYKLLIILLFAIFFSFRFNFFSVFFFNHFC